MRNRPTLIGVSGKINSGKDAIGSMIQYATDSGAVHYLPGDYIQELEAGKLNSTSPFEIHKFATPIKLTAAQILGVDVEMMENRDFKATELGSLWDNYYIEHKTNPFKRCYPTEEERDKALFDMGFNPTFNIKDYKLYVEQLTPRKILQLLGTEAGKRVIHENIWVNASFAEFTASSKWVFTDVRFPNEVQAIKDRGGIIINVLRDHVPYCKSSTEVFIKLQSLYAHSDITSGEFIHKVTFNAMTHANKIQEGIDEFLSWDESPEVFTYQIPHESETALDDYTFDYTIHNGWSYDDLYTAVDKIFNIDARF